MQTSIPERRTPTPAAPAATTTIATRTRKAKMSISLAAWLSIITLGILLHLAQFGLATNAASELSEFQRGAPEVASDSDNFSPGKGLPVANLRQILRRRRSSDLLWSANQRRAANNLRQQQQKSAGDAALAELIAQAQAHNDKNLERALLKILINLSLRPSAVAAAAAELEQQQQQEQQQLNNEPSSMDQLREQQERSQHQSVDGDSESNNGGAPTMRLIANLEKLMKASPGFIDRSSSVNSNDLSQLALDEAYGNGGGSVVDKREFKPCSFNAISCAKNPFRTS